MNAARALFAEMRAALMGGPFALGSPCEAGANLLVANIVGIVLGLIFIGVGIPAAIDMHNSQQTTDARSRLAYIAGKMHQYYNDYGVYPGVEGSNDTTFFFNTAYFTSPPVDPIGSSPTGGTTDFQVYVYGGGTRYIIFDTIAHPSRTLSAYSKYVWSGTAAATSGQCSTCTTLVYADTFGALAQ